MHALRLENAKFGFQDTMNVSIERSDTIEVEAVLPQAPVQLNAVPWADVWLDGQQIGQTPLGNIRVTIGPHEVRFAHPQLGEQRRTIEVSAQGTNRLSVNLR